MFCLSLGFISIFPWYILVKFTTFLEKIKKMKDYTNNKGIEKTIKRYFSSKISQFKQSFNNRTGHVNQLNLEPDLYSGYFGFPFVVSSNFEWLKMVEP